LSSSSSNTPAIVKLAHLSDKNAVSRTEERDKSDGNTSSDEENEFEQGSEGPTLPEVTEEHRSVIVTEDEIIDVFLRNNKKSVTNVTSMPSKSGKSKPGFRHVQGRTFERAMYMFINAHNLIAPQRCRRFHTNAYYANDRVGMYFSFSSLFQS
jgi:hypothetical protein